MSGNSILTTRGYIRKFPDITFLNINEEDFLKKDYLYKHMSLNYMLTNLEKKTLLFSPPTSWKDPYEQLFIKAAYVLPNGTEVNFPWKDRVYCNCFTQEIVSEAHWQIHSSTVIPMEFIVRREKLLEEVSKLSDRFMIFVGKVEYLWQKHFKRKLSEIPFQKPEPPIDINSNELLGRLLLLKRNAYLYEDEFRIILVRKTARCPKSETERVLFRYDCHNYELYKEIKIGPEVPEEVAEMIRKVLSQPEYDMPPIPEANGHFRKRISRSKLLGNVGELKIQVS